MAKPNRLVWMDLEMTGLEPDSDHIIEIATIVTDNDLNILAEGPDLVIHQPDSILDTMDEWCVKQHGASGLTERVQKSTISVRNAEIQTLDFIKKYVEEKKAPLCGNSIHQDRRFLYKYMPELVHYLHYRNVDVSSVKEMVCRWYNNYELPKKNGNHRAMGDVISSIEELRFYRERYFVPPNSAD